MSTYPDEAPAFSSDEEPKNAKGVKGKDAKAPKKQADTKAQPNKHLYKNHHYAWV